MDAARVANAAVQYPRLTSQPLDDSCACALCCFVCIKLVPVANESDARLSSMQESPTCKLLYVTPEQLVRNGTLHELLAGLHRRGRLARLVVDEVPFGSHNADCCPASCRP